VVREDDAQGEAGYALVFSVEGLNVTNTVSPAPPVGVLTSPFFGRSIATSNNFLSTSAANRTVMLHTAFFAPLPLDGRGFQPFFAIARFSTSFAVKQRFRLLFAEPQIVPRRLEFVPR
jgi:hypothetical protein